MKRYIVRAGLILAVLVPAWASPAAGRCREGARDRARQGTCGRHCRWVPREARGAHRYQRRRLRPRILLQLAR
jgi:hypothetical protein